MMMYEMVCYSSKCGGNGMNTHYYVPLLRPPVLVELCSGEA